VTSSLSHPNGETALFISNIIFNFAIVRRLSAIATPEKIDV
jgi:hypothetical protein